jgi:DNA-directed RNA polymerase subunit beta'
MIYRNIKEGTFFMNKLLVISPEMRPISVLESVNQMAVSELTKIYQRVIILSNQLYSTAGTLFDIMVYKMQLLLREVYEFIKSKSASKSGIIRNMMLGRRTDFSSRAVIAPDPTLEPGYIGLPMRIAAEIFEPFIIYSILTY